MSEKLDVIISEKPGLYSIENFESLKSTLEEYTKQYVDAAFNCEDKNERLFAKGICAELRSMKEVIESKRKSIKKSCLEPYNVLDAKCKELTGMIDTATEGIDKQLKSYEAARQARKKEQIEKMFKKIIGDDLAEYVSLDEIFDKKWLNATASESSIKQSIEFHTTVFRDQLDTIRQMPEDVQQTVLPIWISTKDMSAVMRKVTEFNEQKARILEAERERRESEERKKPENSATETPKGVAVIDDGFADIPDFDESEEESAGKTVLFRVTGSPEELEEVRFCLNSIGLTFEEMEV